MAQTIKKRHVVSYENMSPELQAAFNEKYPKGFQDYLGDVVKIQVKTDDIEDIERWLEGEEEAGDQQVAGAGADNEPEDNTLPDDNIAQYGSDDDDSAD